LIAETALIDYRQRITYSRRAHAVFSPLEGGQ